MSREIHVDERLSHSTTIPSWCYTDPAAAGAERDRIFARTWQMVGREDQVATVGSYFTAEVAGEPLLIVRGNDHRLRALSNVCRHRAGPVAKGEGSCGAFRCGYHGWSYALDGQLSNTPEFDGVEDFEKASVRLPEFRVETWLGLVFASLDPARRLSAKRWGTWRRRSTRAVCRKWGSPPGRTGSSTATGRSTSTTTSRGTTSRSSTPG